MKKWVVMQGILTNSGSGDFWCDGEFDTLKEATKRFNEIKNDTKGCTKGKYLETHIELTAEEAIENGNEIVKSYALLIK